MPRMHCHVGACLRAAHIHNEQLLLFEQHERCICFQAAYSTSDSSTRHLCGVYTAVLMSLLLCCGAGSNNHLTNHGVSFCPSRHCCHVVYKLEVPSRRAGCRTLTGQGHNTYCDIPAAAASLQLARLLQAPAPPRAVWKKLLHELQVGQQHTVLTCCTFRVCGTGDQVGVCVQLQDGAAFVERAVSRLHEWRCLSIQLSILRALSFSQGAVTEDTSAAHADKDSLLMLEP
jgi:hypothetical protein